MNSNSKKDNDIDVDVVNEQTNLKLSFGNDDVDVDVDNEDDVDVDVDVDDDDDDKIEHASSSLSPPFPPMKIIMCLLAVIFVVFWMNPADDDTTMLNQDMVLVGVQEQVEEQVEVEGVWCCPKDSDGCTSYPSGGLYDKANHNCVGYGEGKSWNTLDDGTVCKPKIGGHCCADSTSKQYSWYYINIGGSTGCRKNSF